jgi:DNA-binding NtrC family response regulator
MKSKPASVLIVDDTPENLEILIEQLENTGFNVSVVPNAEEGIELAKKIIPDIILLDVLMPGMDGFETCRRLKQLAALRDIPIIFITALTEQVDKITGFEVGGVDYITKPFQYEEVLVRINTHLTHYHQKLQLAKKNAALILANRKLKQEMNRRQQAEDALQTADAQLSALSQQEAEHWGIAAFIGQSKTIKMILKDIRCLQDVEKTSVLILGESGSGKELVARAIHFGGLRASRPFIPVNCSAIPPELADSAFFGHLRGSFTGALNNRKGHFEVAQGGTLFLDEIGDMPLSLQAKLLRTLEDGQITPLGSSQSKPVDVRIIAATNIDLQAKVAAGEFRKDLYFRLAAYIVTVPPLRERKKDIVLLAEHFLSLFALEMGQKKTVLTRQALVALENYHFPGNVRELKNIIEHALLRSGGKPIQLEHLYFVDFKSPPTPTVHQRHASPAAIDAFQSIDANNDEAKILLYVRIHGSINNTQCRHLLASDFQRASYLLKKMNREGVLVREGERRWANYRLP